MPAVRKAFHACGILFDAKPSSPILPIIDLPFPIPETTMSNAFAQRLQIDVPILLAPMAGEAAKAPLVAAVSNAGGLGVLGAGYLSPEKLLATIAEIRSLTSRPFGVNLFVMEPGARDPRGVDDMARAMARYHAELGIAAPALPSHLEENYLQQIDAVAQAKVPVFSFTFGVPSASAIDALKASGAFLMGTATTVDEAIDLEARGVDAVVAQGAEAGGHRGTYLNEDFNQAMVGTMALVPQVADAVHLPVVAAGGIADRRGVRAALALGASAVSVGTAFLTTIESGVSDAYKLALTGPGSRRTGVTRVFSGRPARGVRNRFMDEMRDFEAAAPVYPVTNALTREMRRAAGQQGRTEFLSLWAGQAAPLSRNWSVAQLMEELREGLGQATAPR
jgi:nitronate monooxygenase